MWGQVVMATSVKWEVFFRIASSSSESGCAYFGVLKEEGGI
jgi:hypothetical protein